MSNMIKPTLSLMIICFVVTYSLALVNSITKETIEKRIITDSESKRKLVIKEADKFKELGSFEDLDNSGILDKVFIGNNGTEFVGYVFELKPKGYAGEINVTVGINKDGNVSGVIMGDNTETPGLGTKAKEDSFIGQYIGKSVHKVLEVVKRPPSEDNDIQAISGATITSAAMTNAVQVSSDIFKKLIDSKEAIK